jgi:predicted small lipoprotein YifL
MHPLRHSHWNLFVIGFENQALDLIDFSVRIIKKQRRKIMKILYRVIYMFTLIVLLTACGGKPAITVPATEPVAATEASMEHSHSEGQADPFELSVAQVIMDSAGFHRIATALSETQTIDPTYLSTVTSVSKILSHTTWPADLNDQAQAFIESLGTFSAALEADNIADAVESSEIVHDAQHELSHSIDHFLEGHAH